jgi:outer membrane receptor for ferrienterochelin and colicins
MYTKNGTFIGLETSAWYTRFSNSIIPDYDSNPNQIIYKNLNGYAVTKVLVPMLIWFQQWSKMILGVTYMDVTKQKTTSKQDSCLLKDLRGASPTA